MSLLDYFKRVSPKPSRSTPNDRGIKREREEIDDQDARKRVQADERSDSAYVDAPEPSEACASVADDSNRLPNMENVNVENLEETTMAKDWYKTLKPEFGKLYFKSLKTKLQEEVPNHTVYPTLNNVYSFTRYSPLKDVKVVILGQDPYHGPHQAHGLAFSVERGVVVPPSLQNMYKELARSFGNEFVMPKHGCLEGWSRQGVLLLNASLTVRAGQASSHSDLGWQQFTDSIIKYIAAKNKCVFMLWGAHAQKKASLIKGSEHLILKTVHPSPLSAYRGFMGCDHFKLCNEWLVKHEKPAIRWWDL